MAEGQNWEENGPVISTRNSLRPKALACIPPGMGFGVQDEKRLHVCELWECFVMISCLEI